MRPVVQLVVFVLVAGCSSERASDDERRRAVLAPPDTQRILAEQREQARLQNDRTELIASDKVVGGITLPRGFTLVLALEHEWYYRSAYVSLAQVESYFQARLASDSVERSTHTTRYAGAREKDKPNMTPVSVRVGVAPGVPGTQEIHIVEPRRGPVVRPSEAEVRAQLEARRQFAY